MSAITERVSSALADRYRIERHLGAGGMATVYLAEDLKHRRKVAVKVLKPELAAVLGAERFVQEITTTASLSHPHILPLFDSGTADGFLYYVMPYIEGETLRDKLTRETQLGVEDAVRIATEVADALDYAHRHGVIHRDIKPENILLHDGRPMVADFGIALAVSAAAGGRMTETGLSLGTPHYMSPEQATAEKEITARSDVYSLASVLYEMLAGAPPHVGSSAQQTIMKIVTDTARPVTELRKAVPPNVAAAVSKALEKLPADRFESAAKFAGALLNPAFHAASVTATDVRSGRTTSVNGRAARIGRGVLVVAGVVVGVLLGWLGRPRPREGAAGDVVRFTVPVPEGHAMAENLMPNLAISPDGRTLAYVANGVLFKHRLDRGEREAVGAVSLSTCCLEFSRDGRWILFGDGQVSATQQAMPLEGGPVVEAAARLLGEASLGANAIYPGGIRIRQAGDTAWAQVTTLDSAGREGAHAWPQLLPGGRLALFTSLGPGMMWNGASVVVQDIRSGERTTVASGATFGRYVASGHIMYSNAEGTLEAVPFDLKRRRVTGSPFVVAGGIRTGYWAGAAEFAVSEGGTLAYVRGSTWAAHRLTWLDRSGKVVGRVGEPVTSEPMSLSPDGRYAVSYVASANADISRFDLVTGERRRLTFESTTEDNPVWSSDGRRVAYRTIVNSRDNRIYAMNVEGGADPELLFSSATEATPRDWSPDGTALVLNSLGGVLVARLASGAVDTVVTRGGNGRFSPDGRWLVFESSETGRAEIYVAAFPSLRGRRQVSTNGGSRPRWSARSGELFFVRGDTMMVSRVTTGSAFSSSAPRPLFVAAEPGLGDTGFLVTADGQRFLYAAPNPGARAQEIHVVLNWLDELRSKAPR